MTNKEINNEQVSLYTSLDKYKHCFSQRTYTRLGIAGINTISDLVSKSKEELLSIKGIGEASLVEIQIFLREIGCSMKCNLTDTIELAGFEYKIPLDTPLKELKKLLLPRAYNALSRANINTLEKLLSKSFSELLKIDYIGEKLLNDIIKFVHSLGYTFEEENKTNEIIEIVTKIDDVNKTNDEITSRIEFKERMLKRYNYLIGAKENLLKQEQELDEQIKETLETLKTLGVKDEQKVK